MQNNTYLDLLATFTSQLGKHSLQITLTLYSITEKYLESSSGAAYS